MIIKINGVELDFQMADADFYERYMERAREMDDVMKLAVKEEQRADYKSAVELMKKKCKTVKDFLDHLFGDGTGEQVCGKNDNVEICLDAYLAIIEGVEKYGNTFDKKMEAFEKRRSRRRTGEKK